MTNKILLAGPGPISWLADEAFAVCDWDVRIARDTEEVLRALQAGQVFQLAVVDREMERAERVLELLAERTRECVRIAFGSNGHAPSLSPTSTHAELRGCEDRRELGRMLQEALAELERRELSRTRMAEHSFARAALGSFNSALEQMLERHVDALRELESLLGSLHRCADATQLAQLVAGACRALCAGRGVEVELFGPFQARVLLGAPSVNLAWVQRIAGPQGDLGTIRIEPTPPGEARSSSRERLLVSAVASAAAMSALHLERGRERDEAQQATILALAKLAEQRDNETGRHLLRVSQYSRLLAEGLRRAGRQLELLSDEWIETLARSAPLHDIGKVGIPDRILLKPGKLEPSEWEIMKTHAAIGAQTLEGVMAGSRPNAFLTMSRDIAWAHHERWDGAGYPRGLSGESIPLSARILTLADVYDALTSVRPYKPAWPHDRARETILGGSGSQFDPLLVEVFEGSGDAFVRIAESLADNDPTTPIAARVAAEGD